MFESDDPVGQGDFTLDNLAERASALPRITNVSSCSGTLRSRVEIAVQSPYCHTTRTPL
jgi:hypothetical protein